MYEARVGPDGGGMRFDHLCLRVRIDGFRRWMPVPPDVT
jgi:hypothetical protein